MRSGKERPGLCTFTGRYGVRILKLENKQKERYESSGKKSGGVLVRAENGSRKGVGFEIEKKHVLSTPAAEFHSRCCRMYRECSVGVSLFGRLNTHHFDTLDPARTCFSNELSGSYTVDNFIGGKTAFFRHSDKRSLFDVFSAILPPFLNIHEPNNNTGSEAYGEEKGEAHPIVVRVVNYRLNDIWTDDAGLLRVSS